MSSLRVFNGLRLALIALGLCWVAAVALNAQAQNLPTESNPPTQTASTDKSQGEQKTKQEDQNSSVDSNPPTQTASTDKSQGEQKTKQEDQNSSAESNPPTQTASTDKQQVGKLHPAIVIVLVLMAIAMVIGVWFYFNQKKHYEEVIKKLKDENEKLKEENRKLKEENRKLKEENRKLKEENRKLKEENRNQKNIEDENKQPEENHGGKVGEPAQEKILALNSNIQQAIQTLRTKIGGQEGVSQGDCAVEKPPRPFESTVRQDPSCSPESSDGQNEPNLDYSRELVKELTVLIDQIPAQSKHVDQAELANQIDQLNPKYQQETEKLKNALKQAEEEKNQALTDQKDRYEADINVLEKEHKVKVGDLESKKQQLEQEIEKLKNASAQAEEEKNKALTDQKDRYEADINELKKEHEEMKSRLHRMIPEFFSEADFQEWRDFLLTQAAERPDGIAAQVVAQCAALKAIVQPRLRDGSAIKSPDFVSLVRPILTTLGRLLFRMCEEFSMTPEEATDNVRHLAQKITKDWAPGISLEVPRIDQETDPAWMSFPQGTRSVTRVKNWAMRADRQVLIQSEVE
jgi:cell division protein FtsB